MTNKIHQPKEVLVPFTPYQAQKTFLESPARWKVIRAGRRAGKCLAEGTLIATPTGPKAIELLRPGDQIMGWNANGTVSPCSVVAVEPQGEMETVELINHDQVYAICSKDHRWLTAEERKCQYLSDYTTNREARHLNRSWRVRRKFMDLSLGTVNEPHAYALGALLGDGCSKQKGNCLYISSDDEEVVAKVAQILGCSYHRNSEKNYTWSITHSDKKWAQSSLVQCNHYDAWCRDRYAHEKTTNLDIIKTWDRESCLAFLAGLFDTDGCLRLGEGTLLTISFTMQASTVIYAIQYLLLALFQVETPIKTDVREKYVNGPILFINIRNNLLCKRILKELSPHLVCKRKQWKTSYENLTEQSSHPERIGFIVRCGNKVPCYDIQIDNKTHLFCLANGLVSHNSFLALNDMLIFGLTHPGARILYVAPTVRQSEEIGFLPMFSGSATKAPIVPRDLVLAESVRRDKGNFRFNIITGSKFYFRSSEAKDQLCRGIDIDYVVLDEVDYFWRGKYLWESVIRPALIDTQGKMTALSSPESAGGLITYLFDWAKEHADGLAMQLTTSDNPFLKPEEIEELAKDMDEITYKREILGEPVGYAGACFSEFDETKHVVDIDDFPDLDLDFKFYAGMDYGSDDPTVILFAFLDFLGTLWIYDELYEPNLLFEDICNDIKRHNFKKHTIYCDPSAKGIRDEIAHRQIAAIEAANNDVRIGIQRVNEWFRKDKVRIAKHCKQTIHDWKNYVWDRTREGIKKDKPKHDNSHGCFAAGTHVATPDGPLPIESIKPGQKVYTHLGIGIVEEAQETGIHDLYSLLLPDRKIYCTYNHPFLVGQEWMFVGQIERGQEVWQRAESLPVSDSTKGLMDIGNQQADEEIDANCIKLSGICTIQGQGRKDSAFITSTETLITTPSKTSCFLSQENMSTNSTQKTYVPLEKEPGSGMVQTKGESGILNTVGIPGKRESLVFSSVNNVEAFTKQDTEPLINSVQTTAELEPEENPKWMTLDGTVLDVDNLSSLTNTQKRSIVPVNVFPVIAQGAIKTKRREKVYNLKTSHGTFFAENILVSNCDAMRYLTISLSLEPKAIKPAPTPGPNTGIAIIKERAAMLGRLDNRGASAGMIRS